MRLRSNITDKTEPKEIICQEINSSFAELSWFRGATMDVSFIGQIKMKRIILSRLNVDNVDRLATILSSICCNNYFGVFYQGRKGES